jgi:large subunit ribosomal protein L20
MPRVKRGTTAHKRRKNVLQDAKGFRWGRKNKFKAAKEALLKAWTYAYRDRKTKKRTMRRSWNVAINIGCRKNGTTYREFIYNLKNKNIELDRKILSTLAKEKPETFKKIIEEVKK